METEYLNELFTVKDQVIVITGGGGILCGTMARGLAKAGAKIAVLDISLEAAQKVVDDITQAGGEAIALYADVLSKETLEKCATQVLEKFGTVDVLINGAGGNKKEATTTPELRFFDLPEDAFQWVFNLNFIGVLLPTQVFGRYMAEKGKGIILNIASINAIRPLTNIPAYSAAKAAVKNFTEWLAVHMSQNYSTQIRVNAIAPGFFLTNQNRFLLIDEKTGEMTPRGKTIIDHTPMGRYGDPEELMSTVIWLLSPGAKFVHGTTVIVDGGFAAFSGV
ncbi:MAG: SDR family oxidoreductase [Anaerolineae bacterium]|nr:SDR family oxidoreductase [Anaerolineae bacterium]